MAFVGLLFQDNEIRLTVEQMANEVLISVAKQTHLVDSDTDMQLIFEPARAGKSWNGVVVGKLTGYREAQIMLCKISQLLLKGQQREVHVLNWTGFQLSKGEWLRSFQMNNIKIHVYLELENLANAKTIFKTRFDYNEQVKGTMTESTDISLNVMCDDEMIVSEMSKFGVG